MSTNQTKKCSKCNGNNGEYRSECKLCRNLYKKSYREKHKEEISKYNKKYKQDNKEEISEKKKIYREEHKEGISEYNKNYCKEYYKKHKKRLSIQKKKYNQENKEKINKRFRKRYNEDPKCRLIYSLRRVSSRIKKHGGTKSGRTEELLGCTVEIVRFHLECKFTEGMNWDNYGEWHIDHIRPCASYDLTDPEQQKECFHYTNLQPLWAFDNLSKGDKWDKNKDTTLIGSVFRG